MEEKLLEKFSAICWLNYWSKAVIYVPWRMFKRLSFFTWRFYSLILLFLDLVWSDPEEVDTWAVSPRGAGWLFGAKVTNEVSSYHKLQTISYYFSVTNVDWFGVVLCSFVESVYCIMSVITNDSCVYTTVSACFKILQNWNWKNSLDEIWSMWMVHTRPLHLTSNNVHSFSCSMWCAVIIHINHFIFIITDAFCFSLFISITWNWYAEHISWSRKVF